MQGESVCLFGDPTEEEGDGGLAKWLTWYIQREGHCCVVRGAKTIGAVVEWADVGLVVLAAPLRLLLRSQ